MIYLSIYLSFSVTETLNQVLQLEATDRDQNLEWLKEYHAVFHLKVTLRCCKFKAKFLPGFPGSSVQ